MAPRRAITNAIGLSRRRGQILAAGSGRTGYVPPHDPGPGQNPPNVPPGQQPAHLPVQTGAMVPWGSHNQFVGVPKDLQYRNQGATAPAAGLPTLNQNQRDALQQAFAGQGNFGTAAGPGEAGVRNLMRQGLAAGLGNGQVNQFLNPNFYRGTADPYGGNHLLRNLTPEQLQALAKYAKTQQGEGAGPMGSATQQQADFFQAFPDLQKKYAAEANVYGKAPDLTNPMGGTPPNAQLGSDGKYHDPNQPLPAGVTLEPPEGATAPQVTPIDQVAEAGHGTPQAALAAGKDPTKHIAYWEDKGWSYNPASDQWTNRNATTQPVVPGTTLPPQGATPQTGDTGAGVPGGDTMPLDPNFIAAQRAAQLQMNSTLNGVNPQLEQIQAQQALAQARLGTNATNDTQSMMESLAGRGVLNSSLQSDARGNLATNYLRQYQDLGSNVAQAYSTVYQQQQDAYNTYQQNLIEALLNAGNTAETSAYTPVNYRTKPRRPNKKKRGNNRG